MIGLYDNLISYNERQIILDQCVKSFFKLGWLDNNLLDDKHILNIHSSWTKDDLSKINFYPYIEDCISRTDWFKRTSPHRIILNLVKSDDVHFIHGHPGEHVALYYANLEWQDGWYGETLFYDKNDIDRVAFTSPYKPGRIILFDGDIPHAIRPQSVKGPKYRMSLSLFFQ